MLVAKGDLAFQCLKASHSLMSSSIGGDVILAFAAKMEIQTLDEYRKVWGIYGHVLVHCTGGTWRDKIVPVLKSNLLSLGILLNKLNNVDLRTYECLVDIFCHALALDLPAADLQPLAKLVADHMHGEAYIAQAFKTGKMLRIFLTRGKETISPKLMTPQKWLMLVERCCALRHPPRAVPVLLETLCAVCGRNGQHHAVESSLLIRVYDSFLTAPPGTVGQSDLVSIVKNMYTLETFRPPVSLLYKVTERIRDEVVYLHPDPMGTPVDPRTFYVLMRFMSRYLVPPDPTQWFTDALRQRVLGFLQPQPGTPLPVKEIADHFAHTTKLDLCDSEFDQMMISFVNEHIASFSTPELTRLVYAFSYRQQPTDHILQVLSTRENVPQNIVRNTLIAWKQLRYVPTELEVQAIQGLFMALLDDFSVETLITTVGLLLDVDERLHIKIDYTVLEAALRNVVRRDVVNLGSPAGLASLTDLVFAVNKRELSHPAFAALKWNIDHCTVESLYLLLRVVRQYWPDASYARSELRKSTIQEIQRAFQESLRTDTQAPNTKVVRLLHMMNHLGFLTLRMAQDAWIPRHHRILSGSCSKCGSQGHIDDECPDYPVVEETYRLKGDLEPGQYTAERKFTNFPSDPFGPTPTRLGTSAMQPSQHPRNMAPSQGVPGVILSSTPTPRELGYSTGILCTLCGDNTHTAGTCTLRKRPPLKVDMHQIDFDKKKVDAWIDRAVILLQGTMTLAELRHPDPKFYESCFAFVQRATLLRWTVMTVHCAIVGLLQWQRLVGKDTFLNHPVAREIHQRLSVFVGKVDGLWEMEIDRKAHKKKAIVALWAELEAGGHSEAQDSSNGHTLCETAWSCESCDKVNLDLLDDDDDDDPKRSSSIACRRCGVLRPVKWWCKICESENEKFGRVPLPANDICTCCGVIRILA